MRDVALKLIADAVVDSVREAGPLGAPAGPLYAAIMTYGMQLYQFDALMDALVGAGKLRKSGHLYFAVRP
jgi:hypothetical protein